MSRRMTGRLDTLEQRAFQREEEIAERIVNAMTQALRDILTDLNLTEEQREMARAASSRHLLAMATALRTESRSGRTS